MRYLKIVVLALLALIAFNASANSPFSEATVKGITVHDFGREILIELSSTVTNSENCRLNQRLALRKTHPFFGEMYSALLSAFHTGTPVHGWVNTCHEFGMPVLTRLDMRK